MTNHAIGWRTAPPGYERRRHDAKCDAKCNAKCEDASLLEQERVRSLEEGEKRMKGEIRDLRDCLEEEKWGRKRLEEKLKEKEEQLSQFAEAAPETQGGQWKAELKQTEERIMKKVEEKEDKKRKRCIIFTDSNGRNATTPQSIKSYIPAEERDNYDVSIIITMRMAEVASKVEAGNIPINGAIVLIDCLGNDARQTRQARQLSPDEHVRALDELRKKLWNAGAADVITCSPKPTQRADMTIYSDRVNRYLKSLGNDDAGHGCATQVRLWHLRGDGLHLQPRFFHVLQKTYAYALMGKYVLDPTPLDEFAPDYVRQAYRADWPLMNRGGGESGRAPNTHYGWQR